MSDFTFIGKKIACEPYVFRGEITASNKLTVVSSSNFLGSITASTISASKFIGYIDSASYALTASYAMNGGGSSLVTGSTYPITSSWAFNSISASYALSSAFAYSSSYSVNSNSSSYALTASYALNAASAGGGNIFVSTSSIIDINFSSSVDNFVTDGVSNTYTLSFSTYDPTQLLVFLDGLEQEPSTDYSVFGTTLTLTSIPPAALELEVRRFYSSANISILTSSLNAQYFTGDGSTTQYALTQSVLQDYDILVTINGLVKKPSTDYTTTGSILNFTSAPPSGSEGQFRYLLSSTTGLVTTGGANLTTGSTYPITSSWAITASYSLNAVGINITNAVSASFYSSSMWEFTHSLNIKPILIQTYDINFNQIIPQNISLVNLNVTRINFPISASGYAIASRSGLQVISSSVNNDLITGSTYPVTSSWSNESISASYALTASYALNGGGSSLTTGSTYPITSSWALNADTSSYVNTLNQIVILSMVSSSLQFIDDVAAAAGGVPLGGLYRNGNFILIRLT
jgi:hypothetical protein